MVDSLLLVYVSPIKGGIRILQGMVQSFHKISLNLDALTAHVTPPGRPRTSGMDTRGPLSPGTTGYDSLESALASTAFSSVKRRTREVDEAEFLHDHQEQPADQRPARNNGKLAPPKPTRRPVSGGGVASNRNSVSSTGSSATPSGTPAAGNGAMSELVIRDKRGSWRHSNPRSSGESSKTITNEHSAGRMMDLQGHALTMSSDVIVPAHRSQDVTEEEEEEEKERQRLLVKSDEYYS